MTPPLAVLFATHKGAFLGAGAAGVAGLALLQRKKSASATGTSKTSTPAGTIPAAAVVPASGVQGAYPDTSSTDMYNQLEGQLERLQSSQAVPVPTPVASSLFAPTRSGQYVSYADGSVREVESDGSLYHLSLPEWSGIIQGNGGAAPDLHPVSGTAPAEYSYTTNLQSKITGGTAG